MGKKVFANGMEIAHKAGDGKVMAAFPDVCLSPPPPPAGPVPVPYPNTSFAKDLQDGSATVTIAGKPLALAGQSYYQTSPLGNEAATRNFGGSVLTHTITGKTYFQAHSMDVKVEGKNVCRHLDITGSNCASDPFSSLGANAESMKLGGGDDDTKCPCCGDLLHVNQKDASGNPLKKTTRSGYYASKKSVVDAKIAGFEEWAAKNPHRLAEKWPARWGKELFDPFSGTPAEVAAEETRRAKKLLEEVEHLMATNADCPNVHKTEDGCGTHFADVPPGAATAARDTEFTEKVRREANERAAIKLGRPVPRKTKVNHTTPLGAGGCPKGAGNTVSDAELSGPCKRIDDLQTALQGRS